MKTILFPTDFSQDAENAFAYALRLAEKLNAKIILHHSCHVPAFASEIQLQETTEAKIFEDASERMEKYTEAQPIKNNRVQIEKYINFGLAVDSILMVAGEKKSDLIIMGTKGATGIEAALLGSNAASVMEKASCPVLVVPENARFIGLRKIIFATDFRDNDLQSIARLSEIAALFHAEILIVHICELSHADELERDLFKFFVKEVKSKIAYPHLSFQFLVGINVALVLNDLLDESGADMIATSMRKRNIFSKLFEKSLTKKLAYHTKIPILTFHAG